MSTFAVDCVIMIEKKNYSEVSIYFILTLILCLGFAAAGYFGVSKSLTFNR